MATRRQFLRTLAAVMALPSYRAAELVKNFGIPADPYDPYIVDVADMTWAVTSPQSNQLLTPSIITREALHQLEKNLAMKSALANIGEQPACPLVKRSDGLQ